MSYNFSEVAIGEEVSKIAAKDWYKGRGEFVNDPLQGSEYTQSFLIRMFMTSF